MPELSVTTSHNQMLETRIRRRLDLFVFLPVTVLYCVSIMEKSNIAYASIAGLIQDTRLQGKQFNNVLSVYFAASFIAGLPAANLLKKNPKYIICSLAGMWGIGILFMGLFVKDYVGLITARFFLGLLDGGMLPLMALYLSGIYKRFEIQSRFGIFLSGTSFTSVFGGLIAAAIITMDGVHKIAGWRWLFIIEGIVLAIVAVITFCIIPNDLRSAWFLTAEEREYAVWRLKQDTIGRGDRVDEAQDGSGIIKESIVETEEDEVFEWREFRRGVFDVQTWLTGLMQFLTAATLNGVGVFLPTIIVGLGFSGIEAQLHSVPPFVLGVFLAPMAAILGDRFKIRGPLVLCLMPLSMMGFIILLTGQTLTARYAGVCFVMAGAMSSIPALLAIIANNSSGHYKRATAMGVQTIIGNGSGILGTYIYTVDQQPRFTRGHSICLCFLGASWILMATNVLYCKWENKERREGRRDGNIEKYKALREAGKTKAPIGDRHPDFIFVI